MSTTDVGSVRNRIEAGMNVRIGPLAECAGLSHQAIRLAIAREDIKAVRLGRAIMIPASEAARLLGMTIKEAA